MHKFDNLLLDPNGYCLDKKHFRVINRYENEDKVKEKFVMESRNLYFKKLLQYPNKMKELDDTIKREKGDIKSYTATIKQNKSTVEYS